jgi:hypothetical protein
MLDEAGFCDLEQDEKPIRAREGTAAGKVEISARVWLKV